MSNVDNIILSKILDATPKTYIVFYKKSCPYCQSVFKKLRDKQVRYKGYDINKMRGISFDKLLDVFVKHKDQIGFNPAHRTVPMIFYNKKFIGGADIFFDYVA